MASTPIKIGYCLSLTGGLAAPTARPSASRTRSGASA